MIDINGHWIGFYTYDKGYSELNKLLTVPFTVTIRRGIYEFVGRVIEEEAYGGVDDEIAIRGRLNGDEIEFIKYYTLEHELDHNNNPFSFKSENPNIVHYKGKYDQRYNKFKGIWEIMAMREDEEGVFHADNFAGHWEMWKE